MLEKTVHQLTQEYGGVEQPDDRHGYRQTFNLPSSWTSTDPITVIYKRLKQLITVSTERFRRRFVVFEQLVRYMHVAEALYRGANFTGISDHVQ